MKNAAVLGILFSSILASADTTMVSTGTVLNLKSLQKMQSSFHSYPCSFNTDTLNRYDFIYEYYDECTCICPCCPVVRISSPRAFYCSKAPMNYADFRPDLLSQSFTKISGPGNFYPAEFPCSRLLSAAYRGSGSPNPTSLGSMRSRLFVFQSNNGGNLPYFRYMLVQIDPITRQQYCSENYPNPGPGNYYPIYDSARVSIYDGENVSTIPAERSLVPRTEFKETNIFTVFGKRIQATQSGGLPSGIYIVNGRLQFLQKNKRISEGMNSRR